MKYRPSLRYKLSVVILALSFGYSSAENYYIDQADGNDMNDGLSEQSAWMGLENVNTRDFQPGDSILFKRGGHWTGILKPGGSGAQKIYGVNIRGYFSYPVRSKN